MSNTYGQGRDAASSGYNQGNAAIGSTYGQGRDAATAGYGQGNSFLASTYGQGRDAAAAGYNQGNAAIGSTYGQGRDALTAGYGGARGAYQALMDSSNSGANAYGDASGANGAAGLQRATQNFQSSPQYGAYGFSLDQGLQALNRTHAAAGNLSSGNADADSLKYATGLAGQQYANYLSGLNPYLSQQANATAGVANADVGLGTGLNSSYQGQGAATSANNVNLGSALNSSYQGQGAATNANDVGQGNTINASYQGQGGALNANAVGQGGALNNSYQGQGAGINSSFQGQGNAANANFTGQGASNAAATMNNYNVGANQLSAVKDLAKGAGNLFGMFN